MQQRDRTEPETIPVMSSVLTTDLPSPALRPLYYKILKFLFRWKFSCHTLAVKVYLKLAYSLSLYLYLFLWALFLYFRLFNTVDS